MLKNLLMIIPFLVALPLMGGLVASPTALADDSATSSSIDGRIKALEEQLQRQEEQNKKMMELLQNMANSNANQKSSPSAAAQPPTSAAVPDSANAGTVKPEASTAVIDKAQYTHGWRARIYALSKDFDVTSGLPATELGSFVATKSGYAVKDYSEAIGMTAQNKSILWRGEAFLEVKDSGPHIFSLDANGLGSWRHAYGSIFVEGTNIGSGFNETVIGAADLEPGIYKVEFWVAAGLEENGRSSGDIDHSNKFNMMIKRPADELPVPISEVFLVKKSSKK